MDLQQIFINNLKFFRKRKGLSQNDLSLALNKGYNYINGVEQRKGFPPPSVIEQIAQILEIAPIQLFDANSTTQNYKNSPEFADALANKIYFRLRENLQSDIKKQVSAALEE